MIVAEPASSGLDVSERGWWCAEGFIMVYGLQLYFQLPPFILKLLFPSLHHLNNSSFPLIIVAFTCVSPVFFISSTSNTSSPPGCLTFPAWLDFAPCFGFFGFRP